jgi:hypothetical protein
LQLGSAKKEFKLKLLLKIVVVSSCIITYKMTNAVFVARMHSGNQVIDHFTQKMSVKLRKLKVYFMYSIFNLS